MNYTIKEALFTKINHHRKGSKLGLKKNNKTQEYNTGTLTVISVYKHGNLVNISCLIIFLFNGNENE